MIQGIKLGYKFCAILFSVRNTSLWSLSSLGMYEGAEGRKLRYIIHLNEVCSMPKFG